MVFRHVSSVAAEEAATWAEDTYLDSNAEYKITKDLSTTNVTYCSKIVWQAYYYGPTITASTGDIKAYSLPYDLPRSIKGLVLQHTYRPSDRGIR